MIICFFSLCIKTNATSQIYNQPTYRVRHINIDNGLPHSDANVVIQDQSGYIWIGTYAGLSRYDGYEVTTYYNMVDNINDASLNRIYDIDNSDDGLLWIATSGKIQLFDPREEKYLSITTKHLTNREDDYEFEKITTIDQSHILVKTNKGRLICYRRDAKNNLLEINDHRLNIKCQGLYKDSKKRIWIATENGGYVLFSTNKMCHFVLDKEKNHSLRYIFADSQDNLLIATNQFLYQTTINHIQLKDGKTFIINELEKYPINFSEGLITDIVEEDKNNYWVSSTKGLFNIQRSKNGKFTQRNFYTGSTSEDLNSDFIISLFIDRSKNLFISTYGGGVNIVDLFQKPFYQITDQGGNMNSLSEKIVRAIADDNQYLWIGTNTMGLNRIDKKTGKNTVFKSHPNDKTSIGGNGIRSLLNDGRKYLWVGHTQGLDLVDLRSSNKPIFRHIDNQYGFPSTEVTCIVKDYFNQIWVGTWDKGIYKLQEDANQTITCQSIKKLKPKDSAYSSSRIISLYADSIHPEIFYSSGKQLTRLYLNNNGEIYKTRVYQANKNSAQSINSNFICSIRRENDSILWIGTLGGGINKMKLHPNGTYSAQTFTENKDMKDVECIEIDAYKNIWGGGNGLIKMSKNRAHSYNYYKSTINGRINTFKIGGSCIGKDGTLYFGGTKGVTFFNPQYIYSNRIEAIPMVSAIYANDQKIKLNDQITLSYKQNNIRIHLTNMHYADPENCKYEYRLLNFDQEWKDEVLSSHIIQYTNLSYGNYTLEVKASNNDGVFSHSIYKLPIRITPPWWLSIPAKVFYLIFFTLFFVLTFRYRERTIRHKREQRLLKIQELQEKQIKDLQLQFFTNVSHEFRTPLTLILGTIEVFMKKKMWDPFYGNILAKNAKRLMELVDSAINFDNEQNDIPQLAVQESDIHQFVKALIEDFHMLAATKEINLNVTIPASQRLAFFDPEFLNRILLNILNNAFKYTSKSEDIKIEVLPQEASYSPRFKHSFSFICNQNIKEACAICISDTGVGISKEDLRKIFIRHFQEKKNSKVQGSGIGLALVKSLIERHKGNIIVSSEEKKGTEFYISIPCLREDYSSSEIYQPSLLNSIIENNREKETGTHTELQKTNLNTGIRLLLIEDNNDVRLFLTGILQERYHITQAVDGLNALNIMKDQTPDIIISDLMMPNLDGNALCKILKDSDQYKHIPFILLTAKKTTETQIESANSGADAYLCKPVSFDLLYSTIENLLSNQKRIRKYVSTNYIESTIEEVSSNKDHSFYNKLLACIEKNISNTSLDVELICKEMGYSRSNLYQKVKEATNLPIKELVRKIRLKKSIQIMAEKDLPISELIVKIGIQSQSYFTTSFKKEYGKTPAQYIRELKENNNKKMK